MSVSNVVIRACLLYEFKLGTNAAEATRKICRAFGQNTVTEPMHKTGTERSEVVTLEDQPRSGRPSSLDEEQLKQAIEEDSSLTCQELAERFNVSDETIRRHLHQLGKT